MAHTTVTAHSMRHATSLGLVRPMEQQYVLNRLF